MLNRTSSARANLIGSLWMIAAMAGFAVEDAALKSFAADTSIGLALLLFGIGGMGLFAVWSRLSGYHLFARAVLSRPMCIRAGFEVFGRLFYTAAIALTPLSAATVILQATPLVVVAGAAILFGEHVGWRRWLAICVGLTGVLVVVQPGGESFTFMSLLAVAGMLGFAGRDLASRAAPASLGTAVLGFYGFAAIFVAGGIVTWWENAPLSLPDGPQAGFMAIAVLSGVFAYSALMKAMRSGEISAVTPFRYTRLIFGIVLGVVVFSEQIGTAELLGCGLIVLSGVFIMWRSAR